MILWYVKVVPDAEPNADGVWETVEAAEMSYDFVPRPGFHVVQYRVADLRQPGTAHRIPNI